jgi:integrase
MTTNPFAITFGESLAVEAREYLENAQSPRTRKTYCSQWKVFSTFCSQHELPALPASSEVVAAYLTARARTAKASTLSVALAAIDDKHSSEGYPRPGEREPIKKLLSGIRRTIGTEKTPKAAFTLDILREAVGMLPNTLAGVRDRAVLLVGFAGAFRRSELAALDVGTLRFVPDGVKVHLRHSKTDQEKKGRVVGIPQGRHVGMCPPTALRDWLVAAGIYEGKVFRSLDSNRLGESITDRSIATIVKLAANSVGHEFDDFSGHSLRSGFCTSASHAGVDAHALMRQTGHTSIKSVIGYIQEADVFRANPARRLL